MEKKVSVENIVLKLLTFAIMAYSRLLSTLKALNPHHTKNALKIHIRNKFTMAKTRFRITNTTITFLPSFNVHDGARK